MIWRIAGRIVASDRVSAIIFGISDPLLSKLVSKYSISSNSIMETLVGLA
jgi:hypothetical protein